MNKIHTSLRASAALACIIPGLTNCSKPTRPNIIFFLVDDMGWSESEVLYDDIRYPEQRHFRTPNMLRLAEQGVKFSSAYACPVSTPTRTSLLSGMNAAHTGVTNWTSILKDKPSDYPAPEDSGSDFTPPEWNINGISPEEGVAGTCFMTPFVQLLRDSGYYTIHVGKAHWAAAGTPGSNPLNLGFMVNVGGSMAGHPQSYLSEDRYGNIKGQWSYNAVPGLEEYYDSGTHLTEALTREALKAVDTPIRRKQPFFLYLAHYSNHTPVQADERFIGNYSDSELDEWQKKYASMVEGVDKSLGDVLDFVEEKKIAKNTIIIFMTDNGGDCVNVQKGGLKHTHNMPLREGKGSVYEGGIRVPLIVRWDQKIAAGVRIDNPVIVEDLYPTLLDFGSVSERQTVQQSDGVSLCRLMTEGSKYATTHPGFPCIVGEDIGGVDPQRPLIFHYPHHWQHFIMPNYDCMSALRSGKWKLVYCIESSKVELYDLYSDIGEKNDVALQNPEVVRALSESMGTHLREWKAPMPTNKSTGTRYPFPDE